MTRKDDNTIEESIVIFMQLLPSVCEKKVGYCPENLLRHQKVAFFCEKYIRLLYNDRVGKDPDV